MITKVLFDTQFCEQFIQGMSDRMSMSYYKYGPVQQGFSDKVNAIETLKLRLKQYMETGNKEFLMDVANYAMIEFMLPKHPNAFFRPTDSKDSPGRIWNEEKSPNQKSNKDK